KMLSRSSPFKQKMNISISSGEFHKRGVGAPTVTVSGEGAVGRPGLGRRLRAGGGPAGGRRRDVRAGGAAGARRPPPGGTRWRPSAPLGRCRRFAASATGGRPSSPTLVIYDVGSEPSGQRWADEGLGRPPLECRVHWAREGMLAVPAPLAAK